MNPLPDRDVIAERRGEPRSRAAVVRGSWRIALVLNTTAFAAGVIDDPAPFELAGDAPVLQVILSGGNREDWAKDNHGLNSRDVAMHVALPEVDGRIITRAISFKGLAYRCKHTQVDVVPLSARSRARAFRRRAEPRAGAVCASTANAAEARRADPRELSAQRRAHRQWRRTRYAGVGGEYPGDAARRGLSRRHGSRRWRRADACC